MTKKKIIIGIIVAAVLFVSIEGTLRDRKINDMPNTAVPAEFVEFQSELYPDITLTAIEYNGRLYADYGCETRPLLSWEIGECIAFHNDSRRFYTLTGTDDYIADIYMGFVVHEAVFYRALDTNGKDIKTPMYIKESPIYCGSDNIEVDIWGQADE